jgi:Rrf2 family protein
LKLSVGAMLKINKKVEYALIALKYISDESKIYGKEKLISAREICDHFHTPFDTTAKVMQMMNNRGLLKSVKGIKGGYTLNCDLKKISFRELTNLIEERPQQQNICTSKNAPCELISSCNIVGPIENLNHKVNEYLNALSVSELLGRTN